jgi:RNA polymerase sigma-70 factor (ECF subfamily)
MNVMEDNERQIQFTQRFSQNERAMRAFACSLIPNREDVNDVIQETLKELWRKFDEFDPARPFLPWANRFVYRQVLIHRRSTAIRLKYTFSEETFRRLVEEQSSLERDVALSEALDKCLHRLDDDERELLNLRYFTKESINEMATREGLSVDVLYKRIQRIREELQHCISKRMEQEGWA